MGVLRGDTIALVLFLIALDYVLKQTNPNHGIKTYLPDSDASLPGFDIVTFDSNKAAAGKHLQNLQDEAAAVGTEDKSKIFLLNYQLCS